MKRLVKITLELLISLSLNSWIAAYSQTITPDQLEKETGGIQENQRLPSSPESMWNVLFNLPVSKQTWGVESDGQFLYCTFPYDPNFAFGKYTNTGVLLQSFNIPGVPVYSSPNFYSLRDMCNDGTYFYAISYEYPSAKLYKLDLINKNLISSVTLPFSYGYQVTFDHALDAGNGGFWCGDYYRSFSVKMDGTLIGGPYTLVSSCYGSATDEYSNPGTKHIWYGSTSAYALLQWNPLTQAYTGVSHSLTDLSPSATYPYVYGLSDSKLFDPGNLVLLGTAYYYSVSSSSYHLFCYEMAPSVMFPIDVGVVSIVSPVSGTNLGTSEIVQAIIKNYGTTSVSNIPVKYSINGAAPISNTIPNILLPGQQLTWQFSPNADLHLYNNYQVCVTTMLAGDQFPPNDGKCKTVKNNFPSTTDTIWPNNLPNWTGTVEGPASPTPNIISQNSLIKYGSGEARAGWAKFPLTTIPSGVQITDVGLSWWLQSQTGAPCLSLHRLTADPITTPPASLYYNIKNGFDYTGMVNSWSTAGSWHSSNLQTNGNVLGDIQNAVDSLASWFGIGFYDPETCASCYNGSADGWNETHTPYLKVSYQIKLAHDVGVDTIIMDDFILSGTLVTPKAKVRNYGSTNETFSIVMTGPSAYTSSITITRPAGSGDTLLSFTPLTLTGSGMQSFNCCAVLATDVNYFNQCKGKQIHIDSVLTRAFGYITQSLTPGILKGPATFYLEHPDVVTQITVNTTTESLVCGTWGKDPAGLSTWYAAELDDPSNPSSDQLVTINTNSGAYTFIGPLGVAIDGMSYDYITGKLYGISSNNVGTGKFATTLYEINRLTGQAVLFANLGYTAGKITNLACNANGMLFFTDVQSDRMYSVDPLNYSKELLGSAGNNFKLNSDMEFDRASGNLFLSAVDSNLNTGAIYRINSANCQNTFINYFPNGIIMSGIAIPYNPILSAVDMGIMTISSPKTGVLTNNEAIIARVRNYGTTSMANFNVSCQLGSGAIQTFPWAGSGFPPLAAGDWIDLPFNNLYNLATPGAGYCMKAWVWNATGDANWINDTVRKCVKNTACTITNLCFPGSQPEVELCGNNINGGCNSIPIAYVPLNPGDAWCGSVWKIDTLMDEDWYSFTIATSKTVHLKIRSAFDLDLNLVSLPCNSNAPFMSKTFVKCTEDSLVYPLLPPGTYAFRIAPNTNESDLVCGFSNNYALKFVLIPPQPTVITTLGSLNGLCMGVQTVPVYIDSCYNIQQMHLSIDVPPGVTLMGFNNLNPALNPAYFSITQNATQILITWFSMIAATPGSGLLVNLFLDLPAGTSNLSWSAAPDTSYYANGIIGTIPSVWVNGSTNLLNCNNLSGSIYYAHKNSVGTSAPKLMGNYPSWCGVIAQLWQGTSLIDTACAGYNGNYTFSNVPNGNYTLKAKINEVWGGGNSVDAQQIQMNMVQLGGFTLNGIWLAAGDVNGIGSLPNSSDALLIMRRFVGIIPSFLPPSVFPGKPDWFTQSFNISVNGTSNQTQDIHVLCTGDVNGSYVTQPPPKNLINFNTNRVIVATNGVVEVPVYTTQSVELGSISLVFNYPINLEILDISIKESPENLVFLAKAGQCRLAWYGINPFILRAGDVLLTMKVKVQDLEFPAIFSNTDETVFSDGMANLFEDVHLEIPKIIPADNGTGIFLDNVPNPFSVLTEIQFTLPQAGYITIKVYNTLGEEIRTLFQGNESSGSHELRFDRSNLSNGIYFYKIQTPFGSKVKTMIISYIE
ncbi:MAG: T9SS type A sorting domain-containing protein [Bacteroidota bacterium]